MDNFKRLTTLLTFSAILGSGFTVQAQEANLLDTFSVDTSTFDNIKVEKLYSDKSSSTFLIWVKNEVRLHKHMQHTENIYVLEGSGLFTLGDDQFPIEPGMHIVIPKETAHSVEVLSDGPLKALSVQAPEFNGNDRIFLDQ